MWKPEPAPKRPRAVSEPPFLPQKGGPLTARGQEWGSRDPQVYSHLVAKLKPTAMKAMPATRFIWPRSLMTGIELRSLEKT